MSMRRVIRPATEADTPRLVQMGRRFYETTAYAPMVPMDDADTADSLRNLISAGVILVDDQLTGMVAAATVPFYFNRSYLLGQELFWWVEPEHRRGGLGVALLKALIQWADDNRVAVLYATSQATEDAAIQKLYERNGFIESERGFVRRATWH